MASACDNHCVTVNMDILNKILFWHAMFWLIIYSYYVFCHRGIPNIQTAPTIRKRVIAILQEDLKTRALTSYTIVDVGSGNGRFTREIAQAMPQARVIGIEIAKHSIMWANWQKRKQHLANLEYRQMNFLSYDFAEADVVIMYLIPAVLTALGKKLHQETQEGTLIISNKFPLGDGWQPGEIISIPTIYLHQREVHLYQKSRDEEGASRCVKSPSK